MKELEKIMEEIKTEKKETLGPCRRKDGKWMTEKEAIEKIRKEICNSPYCNDNCKYDPCGCAYGMAMDSLEEIQQRREKGKNESMTEDEAIELIEHLYMFNENDRWMSNGPMKIFTEYLKDSLKELKQYREIDKKMVDVIQNIRAKHPHGKIQEEMKRRYMREQDGENH